jgi:hypothetical protein
MSDILLQSKISLQRWWPVIMRAGLYFLIAMIPEFLKEVRDFWKVGKWPPPQVNLLGVVSGSWGGLVAVRAFLDTFLQRHSDELVKKDHDTAPPFPKAQ